MKKRYGTRACGVDFAFITSRVEDVLDQTSLR